MDSNRRTSRRLAVTFVDDSEVKRIRTGVGGKVKPLRERQRNEQSLSAQSSLGLNIELPPLKEEDDDVTIVGEVLCKPTELLEEQATLKGSSIYGFSTPKKRFSMLEKAGSARKTHMSPATPKTPKTPKTQHYAGSRTPRTPESSSKYVDSTPRSRRSLNEEPKTPYSLRKRVQYRIKKIAYSEDSSSTSEEENENDDNYSPSGNDDSEYDQENSAMVTPITTPKKASSKSEESLSRTPSRSLTTTPARTPTRTPSRGRRDRKVKELEMVANPVDYFLHQSDSKKIATSDRTLNHLQTPRLSPEELQTLLSDGTASHQEEKEDLFESHVDMFSEWMTFLCENFSVFLYGLGSKKELVTTFKYYCLGDIDHIVINGFFPSVTLKNILDTITEDILLHIGSFHSYQDQLEFILNAYRKEDVDPLFILIHNLDGPMLRAEKTQTAIARIASLRSVHLLASIDHINAPLIFDSGKLGYYNVVWYDATTLAPYTEETSYENSLLVQQSGALALSSLIHVFKSLTPNAKGIFLLLAKHQLDQKDNSNYIGLSFGDMYQRCREAFLVNSDLTLRAQLTEFRDHKLIRTKKGADGTENLLIPLDSSTLQDFISQQDL